MLRWRFLLGAVLIAALAGLGVWDFHSTPAGLWVTLPVLALLSVAATQELLSLFAARGLRPVAWPAYVINLGLVAVNWLPLVAPGHPILPQADAVLLAAAVLVYFLAVMHRYERPGVVMERLALGLLVVGYAGVLFGFLAKLRLLPGGVVGIPALLSLILVVKLGDIGAYTLGRLFGRHKMAPVLSPGKTWEGAVGAVLAACLGGWLSGFWLVPAMSTVTGTVETWRWLVYGVLVGVFGLLGDLAESLIKRDVGRKDSSTWMPGFGGVLDILDSILFAAPVAYLCWVSGLVGP